MPRGIYPRFCYKEGSPQWRGRLGGLKSTLLWRQFLVKKFNQLEKNFGREYAVMTLWRAGKRSGFDKAGKGRKRSLTNQEIEHANPRNIQKMRSPNNVKETGLHHKS